MALTYIVLVFSAYDYVEQERELVYRLPPPSVKSVPQELASPTSTAARRSPARDHHSMSELTASESVLEASCGRPS